MPPYLLLGASCKICLFLPEPDDVSTAGEGREQPINRSNVSREQLKLSMLCLSDPAVKSVFFVPNGGAWPCDTFRTNTTPSQRANA